MREREVDRLCLRCDWSDATRAKACPRCGTTLYRAAPPRTATHPSPETAARSRRFRAEGRHVRERPPRRPVLPEWARGGAGMAAVLVVAVTAVVVIGGHTPSAFPGPESPSASSSSAAPGLDGVLIYTAPEGPSHDRLWVWDLAAGSVHRGPLLPKVLSLVNAYRSPDAWLGAAVEHGEGEQALLVRLWGASDRPDVVATGDRVAWGPGGLDVTAASIVGNGTCGPLAVRTVMPAFTLSRNARAGRVCGAVRTVGRGSASGAPYVDVLGGGTSSIFQVDGSRRQPVLADHVLLGVSPNDDLLVEPFSCIGPGAGPTTSSCPGMGTLRTSAQPPRARLRLPKGGPFLMESLAAWSSDGRSAYVVGTLHDIHGVYVVHLSDAGLPSTPRLVWQSLAPDERVALTDSGRVILARDGIVSLMSPSGPAVLDRPGGPTPQGPIVWMRSLPYSPA